MTRRFALVLSLAAALAAPAWAYVPGGHAILLQFAEAQASLRAAQSPLIGTAHRPGSDAAEPVRIDLTRGGCRATLTTPEGSAQVTLAAGRISSQGPSVPALEAFVALGCPLFAFRKASEDDVLSAVTQFAESHDIDLGRSSLSRVDDRVGYIVGAPPRDPQQPQLWFDQQTDRPLRVLASHGGSLWDIRLLDAASIATNRLAPRIVIVWQNGIAALELRLMAQTPRLSGHETPSQELEEDEE